MAILGGFVVLATACGGSESVNTASADDDGSGGSASQSIRETAEANQALLEPSQDITAFEVLNVRDGGISSLGEVVTGDRPVLIWFWSPH